MLTLKDRIKELAKAYPKKTAVAFRDEVVSYQELYKKCCQVAAQLEARGIGAGDRVVFSAVSRPEMVYLYLGITQAKAVAVFADRNASLEELRELYGASQAKLLITNKLVAVSDDVMACGQGGVSEYRENEISEISEIIFTSGSTGMPKGCVLSYQAIYHIAQNTIHGVGMRSEDVILIPLPLHHSFALRVLRAALFLGATVVLQNGFTFAKELERNIGKFGVTGVTMVAASVETVRRQMQGRFDNVMGRLRYLEVGASFLTLEQRWFLKQHLPNTDIINTWGSSETGGCLFFHASGMDAGADEFCSLGKPVCNVELGFFDENFKRLEGDAKNPGRMAFRGGMQMSGYWGNDSFTKKTMVDGWLLTGDLCYQDKNGYVYMLGRMDDMIHVGGEKVAPFEIEQEAVQMRGVYAAVCFGVDDPKGICGQIPVLYVSADRKIVDQRSIRIFLKQKLHAGHMPQEIHFITEIPRNAVGKVDKKALEALWSTNCNA